MKRAIKFRGKIASEHLEELISCELEIPHNNGWVVGNFIAPNLIVGDVAEIDWDFFATEWWVKIIPETVGQFTGLKDRNGVEIYEGDVVRYETDYDLMRFEVKWNKDTLMWEAVSQVIVDEPLYYKNGFIEIIGTIHDNLELIKPIGLPNASKSFTAEGVVNELEDCDTLDDAIMFFKEH